MKNMLSVSNKQSGTYCPVMHTYAVHKSEHNQCAKGVQRLLIHSMIANHSSLVEANEESVHKWLWRIKKAVWEHSH